jgi:hypothetical protein
LYIIICNCIVIWHDIPESFRIVPAVIVLNKGACSFLAVGVWTD